ncbi:hypothetical protein PR003_g6499 [Phytophthora rubi]|uniref:Uncharacterized protein n=1 Tax=Phytophthora rubi TaxID=129364 RepID=A0A6A3NLD1_9STRA|nr:hypothetical protein PR002_g8387 [Phytophthora rubi]KAE9042418.1 hypothetical protein PR001_g6199 [Phytophthora rubi]KAE9348283.1 hypothetical protein PR003_g6499 [Phytophthora rubi]
MGPLKSSLHSTWVYRKSPKTVKVKRLDITERTIIAWNSIDGDTVRSNSERAIPRRFEAVEFM